MRTQSIRPWQTAIAVLVLAGIACNALGLLSGAPPATAAAGKGTPAAGPTAPPGVYLPAFAEYPDASVSLPSQFNDGYTLPVDLGQVGNLEAFDLSAEARQKLGENGFVVVRPAPGTYDEFYQVYESLRYEDDQPVFITTDAVFHVYHLVFDKMLRDLEREKFIAAISAFTRALLSASIAQRTAVSGTALEEPALRNVAFFAVAAQLLGLTDDFPGEIKPMVDAELALIQAHQSPQVSPIWDRADLPDDKKLVEDYSQYVPRGHYTRSEELERYFRTMMWYGRLTFRLRDAFETQRALLVVQALRNSASPEAGSAESLWRSVYEPTVFIVGKADDLSVQEYGALSDEIFGAGASPAAFADEGKLEQFREAAAKLPPPQVNSMWVWIWEDKQEATSGFRVMGQRFTLDAYVFGQLIWRNVGSIDNPRGLPKALDFFAAMGSQEALDILDAQGETAYANYPERMQKVRTEIAGLGTDSWTQNLYWAWLYSFQPLLTPKDMRYPAFMRTASWTRKELNTALGSWTELKHDTILYAKQVMAEMGGMGPENPPRSYVEPNPEVYARLLALSQMTRTGLDGHGLLTELTRSNLENLEDLLAFLKGAGEKELALAPISEDDYTRMRYFGGELEALTLAAADRDPEDPSQRDLHDQKAALVADVATGIGPGGQLAVLEEAIGQPAVVYVVLPDQPWRVAAGAVFTHYEFTVPPEGRMTDEAWQAQEGGGQAPPLADWTSIFFIR
jgi:hypothetical protein